MTYLLLNAARRIEISSKTETELRIRARNRGQFERMTHWTGVEWTQLDNGGRLDVGPIPDSRFPITIFDTHTHTPSEAIPRIPLGGTVQKV